MKSIRYMVKTFINNIQSHIKYKLFILLFVLVSIPVILLGYISYSMSSATVEKDYIQDKMQMNNQIVSNINRNISSIEKLSMSTYLVVDDMNYMLNNSLNNIDSKYFDISARLNSYFLSLLQASNTIDGIALINKKGEVKASVDRQFSPTVSFPLQKTKWFRKVVSLDGAPLILETHYNEFYDKNAIRERNKVISIARLVKIPYESAEKASGLLIIDEDVSTFFKDVIQVKTAPGEIIIVYGSSGNVLYSTSKLDASDYSQLNKLAGSDRKSGSLKAKIGQSSMIVSYGAPTNDGWKVVSLVPVAELQKQSDFIKNINFTLLILLTLLMMVVSMLTSHFITKRLEALSTAFRGLQTGNFNVSVPIRGSDELSQISVTFNQVVINMKTLIKERYESNILRKQAELESLQSQINPHFLFNTLSSIKASIEESDTKKSTEMIYNLADIFHYSLNRGKYEVTFGEELEHIRKYLDIQCSRFPGKYKITYSIDNEVLNFAILRLTLQPVVENAIHHGLELIRSNGKISITAEKAMEGYRICITDNGTGITENELKELNSQLDIDPDVEKFAYDKIGIYNVNSRIKLHYGKEYGLKIDSVYGKGTTVTIALPARDIKTEGNK